MSYSLATKQKAIDFRRRGYSLLEIANKFHIAKSTISIWMKNITLNFSAKKRLEKRKLLKYLKASQKWKQKNVELIEAAKQQSATIVASSQLSTSHFKFLCSFLFWAEGAKDLKAVKFINSDPNMIRVFLYLFRHSFSVDEKKFRAIIHIHEYHKEKEIKKYWSKITKIPQNQFYRSYLKPHTKKRKRSDYKGSINISYYDARLARELFAIYNMLTEKILGA